MATDASDVIRDLLVELGVVGGDEAVTDLDAVREASDGLRVAFDSLVTAGVGVVAGIAAIAAAGTALAVSSANNAESLLRQAEALDTNVEELQALEFAFEATTGSAEAMSQTMTALKKGSSEALEDNKRLAESFDVLGLSIQDLRSSDPSTLLERMAEGLSSADDEGEALSATMKILGEDVARRTAPLLVQGADGIRALKDEARDLGIVTSSETIKATAELASSWRKLMSVGRELRDLVGAAIAPAIVDVVEKILDWVRANDQLINERVTLFVQGLVGLFKDWAPIIVAVTAALAALVGAAAAVVAVPLVAAFAAANAAVVVTVTLFANLLAVALALGLAWEDLGVYLRGGESLIGQIIQRVEVASPLLAGFLRLVVAMVAAWQSFLALNLRVVVSLAKWGSEMIQLQSRINPVVRAVEALWGLANRNLDGSWLSSLTGSLTAGAGLLDRMVRPPSSGPGVTNNTTTNNSRADLQQTFYISGGDPEEVAASAHRGAREAVSGGVR